MKHALKISIVLLCIVTISMAFAGRVDNDNRISAKKKLADNHTTPYSPPLRQGDVLFVEDGAGYYPPTNPDPVWDSVLTQLYGAGNYGWFGPTTDAYEDGPDLATMQDYQLVIWHNYDMWEPAPTLTTNDMTNIGNYLTGGGKVWLIGQDALYTGVPYWWMDTYFHLDTAYEDYAGGIESLHVHGLAEIDCHSMISICDYVTNPYWSDDLVPDTMVGCHVVLEDTINDAGVGIFYPGFGEWQTAFWTADVRDATFIDYWPTVIDIITGMLDAFGVAPGVAETPSQKPTQGLQFNVRPVPLVQSATISFTIPTADAVKLEVFNTLGQRVVTLVDEYKYAGSYNVNWNGRDNKGVDVPNGIYIVRLAYADVSRTENVIVID